MKESLKKVILIFSTMIAILMLCIFDISRLVEFKNMALGIIIHILLLIGITQIFYFGGISIATLITKTKLWREANRVAKINKRTKQNKELKKQLEKLKAKEVANEN